MSKKSVKQVEVILPKIKTPEEKAAQQLAVIIEQAGYDIERGNEAVRNHVADLDKDPARACEWSKDLFMAAARKQVASLVLAIVEHYQRDYKDGLPPAQVIAAIRKELLAIVIRKARWPEHSTSPTHNYMHQCSLSATTEWLVQRVDPSLGS